ncbi:MULTISPECIES: nucleoside deaminase [Sporosarcina]|uniref:nucleoside deaminase n=1 Tax=Sporosarcina TaxID=1569 RepID=UPI000694391F|nr:MULTISPECIES: nucleoside deaminase [Sporosarcina]WJY27114.1 nucleoside deaminase [Sporosarcina sp. 0.2-SM1T-5]
MDHERFLNEAVRLAKGSVFEGGGPYGAVIVRDGEIIASGVNTVEGDHDPSAHAEMAAIREACRVIASTDLSNTILYASGEPCPMCLAASYQAKIGEIYYACSKQEAMEVLPTEDKTRNFYSDREKPGPLRDVPFMYMETPHRLEPFEAAANSRGGAAAEMPQNPSGGA